MPTNSPASVAALALTVGAGLLVTSPARGELDLRPHARAVLLLQSGEVAGGGEAGLSLGYNPELEPLLVIPELSASFAGFGGDFSGVGLRALAGVRGGVAGPVEPSFGLRIGYGLTTLSSGGSSALESGFAIDAGLGLDVRPERWLTVGGELTYDLLILPLPGQAATLHTLGAGGSVAFWF